MKYLLTPHRTLRHIPVLPFIYAAGVFILMLDIAVEIYHRVSFPCYGKKYIRRRNYIKFDRHKLSYLNPVEKLNCLYCSYANGVLMYISKIVAETESYWCGIRHKEAKDYIAPPHHIDFVEYENEEQFNKEYKSKRRRML